MSSDSKQTIRNTQKNNKKIAEKCWKMSRQLEQAKRSSRTTANKPESKSMRRSQTAEFLDFSFTNSLYLTAQCDAMTKLKCSRDRVTK